MSGNPAFQASVFQNNAFQAGVSLVASNYSVGNLAFATPTAGFNYHLTASAYSLQGLSIPLVGRITHALNVFSYSLQPLGFTSVGPIHFNYHFTTAAYNLGRPAFATPTLFSSSNLKPCSANPYSLGHATFATPSLRQVDQKLTVSAYSLGKLGFAPAPLESNYRLFANAWSVSLLDLALPPVGFNYHLTGTGFSVGPAAWAPVGPLIVDYVFGAGAYWLGHPTFGFPRLQWQVVSIGLPPTYLTQIEDAVDVLTGLLDRLQSSIPPGVTAAKNTARRLIYELRSTAEAAIRGNTLGDQLAAVVTAVNDAGATFPGVESARQFLMDQVASNSTMVQVVFRSALLMVLGLESSIVTRMTYETRDDAQQMILHMRDAFEGAKAIGIDEVDVLVYQSLNALGGAVVNNLATASLQLPRFVSYTLKYPMPSLYVANRIYWDASRSDEIERENKVVHPAFCPLNLRVLSDVGR